MIVEMCNFDGFKNLDNCRLKPSAKINLIYGNNAQGKTNFLEALNIFSGRILTSKKNIELINFNKKYADIEISFFSDNRSQKARIFLGDKNKFSLNGVNYKTLSDFYGKFYSIFFSPSSLSIIKDSPGFRRKFLNMAISQIQPSFLKYYGQYERVLNQRNKILKNKKYMDSSLLEVFTKKLAEIGTIIAIYRQDYILKISNFASDIYYKISNNRERLKIFYKSVIFDSVIDNIYNSKKFYQYYQKLEDSIDLDIKTGFTNYGVHKDDLIFEIDGINLKKYGSQGQKKTCVTALKLAQSKLIYSITNKYPVMLLDEVLSELDEFRQEYLIESLKHNQVFITSCSLNDKLKINDKHIFVMRQGKIVD